MKEKLESFKVTSSKFLGSKDGRYTYEITFNQSLCHTGRFTGIENGLNEYRLQEEKEHEEEILKEAEEILKTKKS